MIVINCDHPEEIEQAKKVLDTSCFGLIIMQNAEEWGLIRTALEYSSDFMDEDKGKEEIDSVWKKLL